MGNYVNIYGLRVILDGVTYQEAAAEIRHRLEHYDNLTHLKNGCIARRDERGNLLLSPTKVQPIANAFDTRVPTSHTWIN